MNKLTLCHSKQNAPLCRLTVKTLRSFKDYPNQWLL